MKRFNFWLDPKTREKVEADMKTTGHVSIATFIRYVLFLFPSPSPHKWTDEQMMDFAKTYADSKKALPDAGEQDLTNLFSQYKSKRQ